MSEKHKEKRVPFLSTIRWETGDNTIEYPEGYGLCMDGILMNSEESIPIGTKGKITIIQATQDKRIVLSIQCKVKRVTPAALSSNMYNVALQFISMTKSDTHALKSIINTNSEKQRHERIPFYSVVRWVDPNNPPEYPESHDLSVSGICISTENPSLIDSIGELTMIQKTHMNQTTLRLKGKVVRTYVDPNDENLNITCLEFQNLQDDDDRTLSEIIKTNIREKRIRQRIPFLAEVKWEGPNNKIEFPECQDISMNGMKLLLEKIPPIGTKGTLTLIQESGESRLVLSMDCEIIRGGKITGEKNKFWMGLKYINMSQENSINLYNIIRYQTGDGLI